MMKVNATEFCAKYENVSEGWCSCYCEEYICYPPQAPNTTAKLDCPKSPTMLQVADVVNGIYNVYETPYAIKKCWENGTWEIHNNNSYTNFSSCFIPHFRTLNRMCAEFENDTCLEIGKTARAIEYSGLFPSFILLIISLCIFLKFRGLRNNRTKIHINLFFATLLQVTIRLIDYLGQSQFQFVKHFWFSAAFNTLKEYSKTSMIIWMFIEGLYLHNMITVTVFQEYLYLKLYFYIGWCLPPILTLTWLTIMLVNVHSTWLYYYFMKYYWILEGPRLFLIFINILFLLNIIRVLVVKLRESHTSEIEQLRRAVRAALFLVPLMGIPQVLFVMDYHFDKSWKFAVWMYIVFFLNSYQGVFVSVLYCFLNSEVRNAVVRQIRANLNKEKYSSCKNFSKISTLDIPDGKVYKKAKLRWHPFRKYSKSPEEKEINICDLNEHRGLNVVNTCCIAETNLLTSDCGDP